MTDGRQYQAMARKQISYRISDDRKDFLVRHPEQSTMADCLALIGEIDDTEAECKRLRADAFTLSLRELQHGLNCLSVDNEMDRPDFQLAWDIYEAAKQCATPTPESEPLCGDCTTEVDCSLRGYRSCDLPDAPHAPEQTESERCLGCLGKSVHHTCGQEPDATPEQTYGDALAALEALADVAWNNVESHENRYVIHHSYDVVKQALTASAVPEEVRRLPQKMNQDASDCDFRGEASHVGWRIRHWSGELERALASAPAVPESAGNQCPECGSQDMFWWLVTENRGGAVDGRIRLSDITPLLVQSCGACSETIQKVSSDEIGRLMITDAPTDGRE